MKFAILAVTLAMTGVGVGQGAGRAVVHGSYVQGPHVEVQGEAYQDLSGYRATTKAPSKAASPTCFGYYGPANGGDETDALETKECLRRDILELRRDFHERMKADDEENAYWVRKVRELNAENIKLRAENTRLEGLHPSPASRAKHPKPSDPPVSPHHQ